MNHKIANILKSYVEIVSWVDKIAGLTQVANIRLKEGESSSEKSFPISCDIDPDSCKKGKYQDLAPDQSKKSVMFFEDRGGVTIEKHEGNRIFYQCQLRLVVWLNIRLIEDVTCDANASCGVSGDYVIDVIKRVPYHPFNSGGFYGIFIEPPEQVERSVGIFDRYTFNEPQTQYLMHPFDYFALDFTIHFAVPCDYIATVPGIPIALPAEDILGDSFTAIWGYVARAEGYIIDVATDSGFTNILPGYDDLDVGHTDEYSVTGLIPGTYYYRVRSYNDTGESGNSNIITVTLEYITDYDGNIYTWITIGTQQWLVENFRCEHYADGISIPNLTLDADWIAEDGTPGHDGAYCYYNNETTYKAVYGALYNWYAVNNAHGLAPAGWRVPSEADWTVLFTFLGGTDVAGGKLKEIGSTHWNAPNIGATDDYGFSAVGAGDRESSGPFTSLGDSNYFWGSTEVGPGTALPYFLSRFGTEIHSSSTLKRLGYSIRLMRDVP